MKVRLNVHFVHFSHQEYSEISVKPYRADGTPAKHNRYTHVNWKFCPFCGKPKQAARGTLAKAACE